MFSFKRHAWNALQPLLDRALDLNPADRDAWLEELRADCPTIARELGLLLLPEMHARATQSSSGRVVPGSVEYFGLHR